ncbi:hypothetical protein Lesp02_04080 [Lentzea sp. NBRC 105346]|uniref:hypothetical protein n=1 Tax=Lentzea sp. NBRC 105346 TaxID=3032205 RepID=UPI0024A57A77|nr:hypothetical protein [Lentzea sp. NBRC 105346]GLZ28218.1 hypothetical protein Lesp02_04080 [Lentzea sp. NBRC 105346]
MNAVYTDSPSWRRFQAKVRNESGELMLDTRGYRWIKDERYDAVTIAIAEGVSEDAVIRTYGGDPGSSNLATFDQSIGMVNGDDDFHLQTLTAGGLVVAIENNGWTGAVAEIARRATADGGRWLSVYWNGAIVNFTVIYAVNGTIEGWYNDRSCGQGKKPASTPEWDEGVSSQEGWSIAPSLALMEHLMGVKIMEEWFTTPQRTTRIPDVDSLLPQVVLGKNISGGDIIQSDPAAWTP